MVPLLRIAAQTASSVQAFRRLSAERLRNTIRFDAGNLDRRRIVQHRQRARRPNYQNALPLVRTQSQYSVAKQILPILHLQIAPMNQSAISDDVPNV
jgi:hypothetical protein